MSGQPGTSGMGLGSVEPVGTPTPIENNEARPVDTDIGTGEGRQSARMPTDLAGQSPRTLAGLAAAQSARLRRTTVGKTPTEATSLVLVPVHGSPDGWLIVSSPLLTRNRQVFAPPVADAALDFALRVDLLLRWILPPVPVASAPRRPGEAAALRVAFASPLALLLLRPGVPTAGDSDVAWWQAFGHACAIVGRRSATALAVTPAGVGEIPVDRQICWPDAG